MFKGYVVVTGAGKRLGFHFAKTLLLHHYGVIAHFRSTKEELDRWLLENPEYQDKVVFCQTDLRDSLLPLEKMMKKHKVVGLINSASTFIEGSLLQIEGFQKQLEINTLVPLALTSLFAEHCGKGFVINMVDANIHRVHQRFQAYRTTKLFLCETIRQLATTLGPNIRINGIAPGTVLPPESGVDVSYQKALDLAPLKKPASIESLCKTLLFLIDNEDITGEIIAIDGGSHTL